MNSENELKKMYWHSRRGMLELDLLLVPYALDHLPKASAEVRAMYRELLTSEDQDLFSWLVRKEEAPSEPLQQMIDIILSLKEENEQKEQQ